MSTTDKPEEKRQQLIRRILQYSNDVDCLERELMRTKCIADCWEKLIENKNILNFDEKTLLTRQLMVLESVKSLRVLIDSNGSHITSDNNRTRDSSIDETCVTIDESKDTTHDRTIEIDLDSEGNSCIG